MIVFNENVLLFIYVQSDSSRSLENSSGPPTNQCIELAQVCMQLANQVCNFCALTDTRHMGILWHTKQSNRGINQDVF